MKSGAGIPSRLKVKNNVVLSWLVATILVAACMGVGLPSEGAAGPGDKLWQERAGGSQQVLPKDYNPLPSLSGLIKQLRPAVVNIYTTQVIRPRVEKPGRMPRFRDPFFEEFFGGRHPFGESERFFDFPQGEIKRNSLGSGFIIGPDGYILTNQHVVADASEIKVKLADDQTLNAKLIGGDQKTDIALLKVESKRSLPFTYLGDSDKMEVGDWVIAIGNPFGLGHTVTAGIVSGKDREIGHGPYDDFIQTDASINLGNSGGPLFDSAGNVVGINTAIVPGGSGVGFAVPINLAKNLLPQLRTLGKVARGWLGVGIQDLTQELAESFGVEAKRGVLVSQVYQGSPADKAGLKIGDVVLAVEGKPVTEAKQLSTAIAAVPPETKVRLEVLREGKRQTFTVMLGEREKGEALALGKESGGKETSLGLTLAPLTEENARRLGVEGKVRGLVVEETDPAGPTAGIIQPGDIILEVNRKRVVNLSDFQSALGVGKRKGSVLIRLQRGSGQLFVVIQR